MYADAEGVGNLAYVAVGATNVGSIVMGDFEDDTTASHVWVNDHCDGGRVEWNNGLLERGAQVGGFRMGSTVVLVWQGKGEFLVKEGDRVKVGEALWNNQISRK